MKTLIIILSLFPALAFSSQGFDTILRPKGNLEVAAKFNKYVNSNQGCKALNDGPRVILTGFGLWTSGDISYSGFIIDNLSSEDFWSKDKSEPTPARSYKTHTGALKKDEGGRISNRTFTLKDGRKITACLIIVDVQWDFAGAVIVSEMDRFQPDTVIMTGIDGAGASIEAGALNTTSSIAGYNYNGKVNYENSPVSREILSDFPNAENIPMTWDNENLAKLIKPYFASNERLLVPSTARSENIYVCNNISYIALKAAENNPISLAGGQIELSPKIMSLPQIGFFHFANISTKKVSLLKNYSQVLMTLVQGTLINK